MIRLTSNSGGKDSGATTILAIERHGAENVVGVFADTGNEHEATYEYVRRLADVLGIEIKWLRQDFTDWWWHRRDFIHDKWPEKMAKDGFAASEIIAIQSRALAVFDKGPTGNPYLDLCIIKGRFPSRKAQFCTEFLKTKPLTEYALDLIDAHGQVESWQGVRADESPSRAKLPEREDVGGGLSIYRPILRWTVEDVFALHRKHGIKPNPLYMQGMNRVGCMPCINASKDELMEISKRFPQHIDRIAEWEEVVGLASRRGAATFFAARGDNETAFERGNIRQRIEWSKTSHGGVQYDIVRTQEPLACQSAYGLCE